MELVATDVQPCCQYETTGEYEELESTKKPSSDTHQHSSALLDTIIPCGVGKALKEEARAAQGVHVDDCQLSCLPSFLPV
jgi:hypothetical protein